MSCLPAAETSSLLGELDDLILGQATLLRPVICAEGVAGSIPATTSSTSAGPTGVAATASAVVVVPASSARVVAVGVVLSVATSVRASRLLVCLAQLLGELLIPVQLLGLLAVVLKGNR